MAVGNSAKNSRNVAKQLRSHLDLRARDRNYAAQQRNAKAAENRARLQRLASQMRERIDGLQARR